MVAISKTTLADADSRSHSFNALSRVNLLVLVCFSSEAWRVEAGASASYDKGGKPLYSNEPRAREYDVPRHFL